MLNNKTISVLSFIDWYRPGYKAGGTITAFGNFVDHLEDKIDFKIITRDTDYYEKEPYPNIENNIWITKSKSEVFYLDSSDLGPKDIKRIISESNDKFLYVNGIFSYYFSILPIIYAKDKVKIINPHGMLSDQAFSIKSFKKILFLKAVNLFGLYKNCHFHVANKSEAEDLKKRIKTYKNVYITNQFPRKIKSSNIDISKKKFNDLRRFVSVTRISVEKGILKMINSLNYINDPIVLDIYGAVYDEEYWQRCQAAIADLPPHIDVNYKGSVESAKIPGILETYDFFILMSEGENFGHAILEAMAAGCPVIISNKTPWTNLEEQKIGWDVHVENIDQVQRVFNKAMSLNQKEYNEMAINAFNFAREFSNNNELIVQNLKIFAQN